MGLDKPVQIRFYEAGNMSKHAIDQAHDIVIEENRTRHLGSKAPISPELDQKMKEYVYDAIKRYKQGIKGIMQPQPFIEVIKEFEY